MVFQINGKTLLECNEDDIQLLIDDSAFRESEYIDYKENFSFMEIKENKEKNAKKIEFRNDVCSFANAEGGYLIYGIKEEQGLASKIIGIAIPQNDIDKFELQRRTDLQSIFPRVPNIKFSFIHLHTGKYVVVMYIKHDGFAPYTQIENEINYKFFKRAGNKKATMTYAEIRNMFNQSLSLDKEILSFRKERINYYSSLQGRIEETYSQFLLFHIISDNYLDHDYNQDMFVLQRAKHINFSSMFSSFHCSETYIPCANGIRYIPHHSNIDKAECYLFNNGIVECFISLENIVTEHPKDYPNGYIPRDYIWDMIQGTCDGYYKHKDILCNSERLFLCLDIIGCKGVVSQTPAEDGFIYYTGTIDRNTLTCDPVVITDTSNETMFVDMIKKLHLNFMLSIGVKFGKDIDSLIKELYPQ